jgi:glycosyltransferase involved in cell wall biosynthesis
MIHSVGLVMIVKNEAHVIRRCLASVLPLIDHWTIVDTGSTDGTQQTIREALSGIPGELYERPWRDFGSNRTEALELAGIKSAYLLWIDADDMLDAEPGFQWPALEADGYWMRVREPGGTEYRRLHLLRADLSWQFVGVLHEYPDSQHPAKDLRGLSGIQYLRLHDGASWARPDKYRRDSGILRDALEHDPGNTRYAFYLAQSLRDAGDTREAIEAYLHRAGMGGWEEEVWYSLFQVARLRQTLEADPALVIHSYLVAYQARPARAEPLCALARYFRERGEHASAYLFASRAKDLMAPDDLLFVDQTVYTWRALDEYAVAAYWIGEHQAAARANQELLTRVPPEQLDRIRENLAFCQRPCRDH